MFDVAGRAADAVTWEPGSDELRALLASRACFAGRRLLPLPETLRSADLQAPPDTQGPLTPYVELLERTRDTLSGLAEGDGAGNEARSALLEAAAHARTGAVCLAGVREMP
ncbi:hypothetical protein LIX60_03915 [Streptomyces sp. S07_1.15]|uniref:hypothetical protein n=1 Tax=Streptomyces sp. S07_1.15 TaxID=2873925 RepID=UPI001D13C4D6|nr:hypothetical protein [Streptomyces sp. S07_1.15]MCC3650649.1 hypothetical protein [Streptomyces sp. S07_1.15]